MITKENIQLETEKIDDEYIGELYNLVKQFIATKVNNQQKSFMSKLKRITIKGPEDFATNLDLYLSGEKSVE